MSYPIQEIPLSKKFRIYRGFSDLAITHKDDILNVVKLNNMVSTRSNNNSVWMEINSEYFTRINEKIKSYITKFTQKEFKTYAAHYWIYTQTKGFDLEWMHQHILVHPDNRTNILTDYTFTYYLQVPNDIEGYEGHIVFETEDGCKHHFLPKEGDIFIFPSDIRHTAIPTPKSETDRIVYAGSFCIDVENQNIKSRNLI